MKSLAAVLTGFALFLALGPPAVADPTESIILINTDRGRGTGFTCTINGTNYIVTNVHVLEGAKQFKFTTANRSNLVGSRLEVARDRDLARIQLDKPVAALKLAPALPKIGDPITVLGNSEGMDTITKLDGKVEGLGPNTIEVNAQFVGGNSGSPILSASDEVLGVATFVAKAGFTNWVNEGTRFDKPRRFGVRLQDVQWLAVTPQQLYAESAVLQDVDMFLRDSSRIMGLLRERNWEQLTTFAVGRKTTETDRYHDADFANQIANFGQSLRSALSSARTSNDARSGSLGVSLQMADMALSRFPDLGLAKLSRVRWSTEHYRERADDFQKVFTRWKNSAKN